MFSNKQEHLTTASTSGQVSPILKGSTLPVSTQVFLVDFGTDNCIPVLQITAVDFAEWKSLNVHFFIKQTAPAPCVDKNDN